MSRPTVISTFSGPGGSSLGYERADCDVRVALDCAPGKFSNYIPETYRRNHPDTTFVEQDARETTADELLEAAGVDRGELDIIDGSPPCSPFSGANTKKAWGDHESGTLFDRYTYFIEEIQPRAFVAENVPGLAQGKTKGYYKRLCQNLRDAGYNLQVQNIDAAYLGAAHHRRRLMFIGVREDVGEPPTIEPTQPPTTVREAWEGLERNQSLVKEARKILEGSQNYEKYCQIPPGGSLDDVMEGPYGFTHHRLSFRKPSPTMPIGSAGPLSNALLPPDEDRLTTLSELKRLTGIPDDYIIPDDYDNGKECICRCLPPVLLETIANELQATVL